MTTLYTDCLNWVMPDLPMAPVPVVVNAIRDAVIDLCEDALIYRQELQQILVLGPTSTTTTVAQAAGDQQVTVSSSSNFNNGDTITVDLTDGTKWRGHVSGTPIANVILLDGQLQAAVDIGAAVTKLVYLYAITVPTGFAFSKGLRAWLNNSPIDPISPDDLDTEFNNTDFNWTGSNWRTDINLPTRWYMQDDATVALVMPPSTAGGNSALTILAALKPSRVSTTFPTQIFERYIETIAHGAKAKMMEIPSKAYSDKELAKWHKTKFIDGVADARIIAARGATRAALRSHTVYGLR